MTHDERAIEASRLPDLPNAGYATRAQKELSDAMMFLIRGFERDRLLLLETVIAGSAKWRRVFKSAYKAIKADDQLADAVFGYFVLLAGPNPSAQKAILLGLQQQQLQQRWDKRASTLRKFERDQKTLRIDIVQDELQALKKRKVFGV